MSENNTEQAAPAFNIQRIYVKGAVLDMPNAPAIFLEQGSPALNVEVNTVSARLNEGVFQTTVSAMVTARLNSLVAFEATVMQAGIFDIRNLDDTQIEQLLAVSCPTLLFPYLRTSVADLISRSGFPPIHLADVNFASIYERSKAKRGAQDINEATAEPATSEAPRAASRGRSAARKGA